MANPVKQNKILVFWGLGLLGFGLIVAVAVLVFFLLQPTQGPIFVNLPTPQIGVAVDRNGSVADVLPGSPAEKAGITRGDVFKQVGNTVLTSNGGLQEVFRNEISAIIAPKASSDVIGGLQIGDLPLVISRGGQNLNLLVKPASPPFVRPSGNQILPTATAAPVSSDWIYV